MRVHMQIFIIPRETRRSPLFPPEAHRLALHKEFCFCLLFSGEFEQSQTKKPAAHNYYIICDDNLSPCAEPSFAFFIRLTVEGVFFSGNHAKFAFFMAHKSWLIAVLWKKRCLHKSMASVCPANWRSAQVCPPRSCPSLSPRSSSSSQSHLSRHTRAWDDKLTSPLTARKPLQHTLHAMGLVTFSFVCAASRGSLLNSAI